MRNTQKLNIIFLVLFLFLTISEKKIATNQNYQFKIEQKQNTKISVLRIKLNSVHGGVHCTRVSSASTLREEVDGRVLYCSSQSQLAPWSSEHPLLRTDTTRQAYHLVLQVLVQES